MTTNEEREVKLDRMQYIKNSASANLAYLAILFDVLFFVSIYRSDVGNYYYQIIIGVSIIYNLIFMLGAFLASEGVKNYVKNYSYLLIVLGIIQIIRIFIIPMSAHSATVVLSGEETVVMGNAQFIYLVVCMIASAACLIASGIINFAKCRDLAKHGLETGVKAA